MARSRVPVITEVSQKLIMPETPEEEAPALLIIETIRLLRIGTVRLLKSGTTEPPVVIRVAYTGGNKPDESWAPRLFARISPERGAGWIARLSKFDPSSRELFLVPRPDRLDEFIAETAQQEINMRIASISLGVFLLNHHLSHEFFLLQ